MREQNTVSCWTEQEIRHQPQMWLETASAIVAIRKQIDAFLTPLLSKSGMRVILTGAGSSAFIGDSLAPILARLLKVPVSSVSTTDIVSDPAGFLPSYCPLLLVSFARSGSSPESIAALTVADQRNPDCHHLLVTCNPKGELYQRYQGRQNVLALPLPDKTCDRGFAMTSSMTSMLLACLSAFGGEGGSLPAIQALAQSVFSLIDTQQDLTRSPLQLGGVNRVIWLGSGSLQGIAHECALKLLELTAGKTAAFYESPVGFRHGPKSLVDKNTQVVVLISNDPYTRRYDLDLLAELRKDGVAASIVALAGAAAPEIEQGDHCYLPAATDFSDGQLAVGFLVYAQIYALSQSLLLGMTPDNPSPEGRVNRVVEGVNIYPWNESNSPVSEE
ncbi:SIS domain-containing protein [Biostraticola tofi]|uniref:Galactosamine 6-phosphate isomerase AgaS n=1 Tax=Biostraticola tofi TaxID=466109 RepID=A0A4R3Z252_9GAMM|nr:SIS domain-containing protein [Biostraticola tofi]TCV97944.1 galactosamine 6-phosphate isomerase AgaS [Biostraticola tofi]